MDSFQPANETSLKGRLAKALKLKPSRMRLTKNPPSEGSRQPQSPKYANPEPLPKHQQSPLELHREKHKNSNLDTHLGERKDLTALLHGLTHRDSFDSSDHHSTIAKKPEEERKPGYEMIASLSSELWEIVARYLSPGDAANLVLSSRRLHLLLGSNHWDVLNLPEYRGERIAVLMGMDVALPHQLFCFPCARFHIRIFRGRERLKAPGVLNPLFICPNALSYAFLPPRLRLTPQRNLPYTFLQLGLRAERYGAEYGVPTDSLARRWREGDWEHGTRYVVHKGHLLLRVTSSCLIPKGTMAPSVQKSLLHSRGDYSPYFSVCQHWEDSNLLGLCKCALNHIPQPPRFGGPGAKLKGALPLGVGKAGGSSGGGLGMVSLCEKCRPMRRCPRCPTEYLIELRLVPDTGTGGFRRALVVTRWSDLGDEMSPYRGEWAACTGAGDEGVENGKGVEEEYDSFAVIGKRAISGIFESYYTADQVPGQKILQLSLKKIQEPEEVEEDGKDDDDSGDW